MGFTALNHILGLQNYSLCKLKETFICILHNDNKALHICVHVQGTCM